eukprot:7579231-Pyramimonas_sp.AAC.1
MAVSPTSPLLARPNCARPCKANWRRSGWICASNILLLTRASAGRPRIASRAGLMHGLTTMC